jgi:hypothetical protein
MASCKKLDMERELNLLARSKRTHTMMKTKVIRRRNLVDYESIGAELSDQDTHSVSAFDVSALV